MTKGPWNMILIGVPKELVNVAINKITYIIEIIKIFILFHSSNLQLHNINKVFEENAKLGSYAI